MNTFVYMHHSLLQCSRAWKVLCCITFACICISKYLGSWICIIP